MELVDGLYLFCKLLEMRIELKSMLIIRTFPSMTRSPSSEIMAIISLLLASTLLEGEEAEKERGRHQ